MAKYLVVNNDGYSFRKDPDVVGQHMTVNRRVVEKIEVGSRIVYYRCSKKCALAEETDNERLSDEAHYFGTAEVSAITKLSRFFSRVELTDYHHFDRAVPFVLENNRRFEDSTGFFWDVTVRETTEVVFDSIVAWSDLKDGESPGSSIVLHEPRFEYRTPLSKKVKNVYVRSRKFGYDRFCIVTTEMGYMLYDTAEDNYYLLPRKTYNESEYQFGRLNVIRSVGNRYQPKPKDHTFVIRHFHTEWISSFEFIEPFERLVGEIRIVEDFVYFIDATDKRRHVIHIRNSRK